MYIMKKVFHNAILNKYFKAEFISFKNAYCLQIKFLNNRDTPEVSQYLNKFVNSQPPNPVTALSQKQRYMQKKTYPRNGI